MVGRFCRYGGRYHSFTPGHSHVITAAEYQALVKQRLAFRDMGADPSLMSAGVAGHWPYGRGVYISEDRSFVMCARHASRPPRTHTHAHTHEQQTFCAFLSFHCWSFSG